MSQGAYRIPSGGENPLLLTTHKTYTFGQDGFLLQSGKRLGPITVAYETYGTLNEEGTNCILILHALTGDAHAAGRYDLEDQREGWWDSLIGPGKPVDTNRYYVVCSNVLGGCNGTTGPASLNPATGTPYAMDFPVYTLRDMVRVQKELLDHLGVKRVYSAIGGSMGGMQVMEWLVTYPDFVKTAVPIATSGRMTPFAIGFNEVMRQAIVNDPGWQKGNYYPGLGPVNGLSIARMLGMITYRSDISFDSRFDRRLANSRRDQYYAYDNRFEVESYLHYQGQKLVQRFDANAYLYLTKAMDLYDIGLENGGFEAAFEKIKGKTLFIGIDTDFLYPSRYMEEMAEIMARFGKTVDFWELESPHGHDAFLIEFEKMAPVIRKFLEQS